MRSSTGVLLTLGVLVVSLGMTGQGCLTRADVPNALRDPPVIIPVEPVGDTSQRTFSVDLTSYPETDRITWEFGDGATLRSLPPSTGQTVTHDFPGSGTFQVSVHLFSDGDLGGAPTYLATGTLPVDVSAPNQAPTAEFSIADMLDTNGQPVPLGKRFDGSHSRDTDGGTITSYAWDFGDGSSASGSVVEHTFTFAGEFVVRLTVVDDRGGSGTATQSLLANTRPTASFTSTKDPQDALTCTFDGTGSTDPEGPIASYKWDFGDSSASQTGQVVTHTYAVPDNYTVALTVTDTVGATGSTSQVVDVTGTDPFVRSITPSLGAVGETLTDVTIDGENFENLAGVHLEKGAATIVGTAITVDSATTIHVTFNLTGAEVGLYTVIVTNPHGLSAQKADAFTVVTPDHVRLKTSMGDIVLQLVPDAPITTANFLQYVTDRFYDGTIFHRVVPGFVVQGGGYLPGMIAQTPVRDPIQNEFSPTRSNIRGTVAMAKLNNDPNSATSQFFINLADNSQNLDNQNGGFTVFANVIQGMDVVDAIAAVPLNGEQPVTDVVLTEARRE